MNANERNDPPPRECVAREIGDREGSAPDPRASPSNGTHSAADSIEAESGASADTNRRRAELIRKKNREGLAPDEVAEYEKLQSLSQAALERAFPASTVGDEALARLEARLGTAPPAAVSG